MSRKGLDPNIPEEEFINFLPPKKQEITAYKLILPAESPTIQFCYSWEFTRVPGRKSVRGRGLNALTATGIVAHARMIADNKSVGEFYKASRLTHRPPKKI